MPAGRYGDALACRNLLWPPAKAAQVAAGIVHVQNTEQRMQLMLNCSQGGHEQAPGGCYFRSEPLNLSVLCLVFCWCIQTSCCMASLKVNPYSANSMFSIILKYLIYKS